MRPRTARPARRRWLLLLVLALGAAGDRPAFGAQAAAPKRPAVLVVGIDAVSWSLVEGWMADGALPNLKKIRLHGRAGPLQSTDTTRSPEIWTTFATGRPPSDHGILNWGYRDAAGKFIEFQGQDRKCRAVWNIFSENGISVNVVNWLKTWPAELVNGAFVSDGRNDGGTYPDGLAEELRPLSATVPAEVEENFVRWFGDIASLDGVPAYRREAVSALAECVRAAALNDLLVFRRTEAVMRLRPADFTALYVRGLDHVQHQGWYYMAPEAFPGFAPPGPEEGRRLKDVIKRYYEFLDREVGRLVAAAGENANVVVVSDHGSGPRFPVLAMDWSPLFERLGWKGLLSSDPDQYDRFLVNAEALERLAGKAPAEERLRRLAAELLRIRTSERLPLFRHVKPDPANGLLRISLEAWAERVRQDPVTGKMSGWYSLGEKRFPLSELARPDLSRSGGHQADGVLFLRGPVVAAGGLIEDAGIYDVAPTLLDFYGLPAAKNMPGRSLLGGAAKSPARIETYERGAPVARVRKADPEPMERDKIEKLKGLGYLQ